MIPCTSKYRDEGVNVNQRYMFKGKCCFPLSPTQSTSIHSIRTDQMEIILDTVGKLKKKDLAFISEEASKDYVMKNMNYESPRVKYKEEFNLSDATLGRHMQALL
mmetsp:Transcript_9935/g.15023  ORF Transcript_9935/g.15023 Transcript_9935/m.15023 type:complete len:105 (-) Transcript_9935:46-360(-)